LWVIINNGKITKKVGVSRKARQYKEWKCRLMQKKIIITGVLSDALLVGGVAMVNTYNKPKLITDPLVTTQAPVEQEAATPTTVGKLCFNGGEYEGEIKDGLASGQGKIIYASGRTYEGAFLFEQESGKGTMTYRMGGKTYTAESWGLGFRPLKIGGLFPSTR